MDGGLFYSKDAPIKSISEKIRTQIESDAEIYLREFPWQILRQDLKPSTPTFDQSLSDFIDSHINKFLLELRRMVNLIYSVQDVSKKLNQITQCGLTQSIKEQDESKCNQLQNSDKLLSEDLTQTELDESIILSDDKSIQYFIASKIEDLLSELQHQNRQWKNHDEWSKNSPISDLSVEEFYALLSNRMHLKQTMNRISEGVLAMSQIYGHSQKNCDTCRDPFLGRDIQNSKLPNSDNKVQPNLTSPNLPYDTRKKHLTIDIQF